MQVQFAPKTAKYIICYIRLVAKCTCHFFFGYEFMTVPTHSNKFIKFYLIIGESVASRTYHKNAQKI